MLFSRLKVWLRCVFLQWGCQPSKNKDHMCSFCWYLLAVSWWQTTPCLSRQTYVVLTRSCYGTTGWDFFTWWGCWGNTQEKGIWTKTRVRRVSEQTFFSKKMIRQSWAGDIPTWSSKAEGFMSSFFFFLFLPIFFLPTSHKIHFIILPDHFVKILYFQHYMKVSHICSLLPACL